jgi:NAD(P)-dependent dehydrogenase (short-subunit alcohol dehydrogenase family)
MVRIDASVGFLHLVRVRIRAVDVALSGLPCARSDSECFSERLGGNTSLNSDWRTPSHPLGRRMKAQGNGRILLTGSMAGFMPGAYQAVYNASKAFINSFSYALRNELKDSGVTVTCLMPSLTESHFWERAGTLDTKARAGEKDSPDQPALAGWQAMKAGKGVVS